MRRGAVIDVKEVTRVLAQHAETIAVDLLPNGRRHGNFWRTGSIADDPGTSLAINLSGSRIGNWNDFAGGSAGTRKGGDILHLVAAVRFGGHLGQAFAWAKSWLGLDGLDPARLETVRAEARARAEHDDREQAKTKEKRRRQAVAMWLNAAPINGTPAELYLQGRGIDLRALGKTPGALRFSGSVWNSELRGECPAMLARVQDLDGRHVATHRTWIEPDGAGGWIKAGLAEPKMCLGSFWGAHIPLWKGDCGEMPLSRVPDETDVWISEGIEDGLTIACADPRLRTVAAVTLGNIGAMQLPEQIGAIVLIGQRDTKAQPIAELEKIVQLRAEQGYQVDLVLPPEGVKDANQLAQDGVPDAGQQRGAA
jgi:hypothetical protein